MSLDDEKGRGPVGSIVNAVDILRYISDSQEPKGVTAISRALSISPSSCFNILKTLTSEGFIEFHSRTKTYALGAEALRLARRVMEENGALAYLRPHLREIAAEFEVTSALWRLTAHDRWVLIGFEESVALARIHLAIGQRLPKYAGSVGRCAAAFSGLVDADLKAEFGKVRWHKRPPVKEHLADVAAVRTQGWALDDGQLNHGVATMAAPVIDDAGRIRYCVTGTMFAQQHERPVLNRIGRAFAAVGDRASRYIFGGDRVRARQAAG